MILPGMYGGKSISSSPSVTPYQDAVMLSSPELYSRLNETDLDDGDLISDISGNANHSAISISSGAAMVTGTGLVSSEPTVSSIFFDRGGFKRGSVLSPVDNVDFASDMSFEWIARPEGSFSYGTTPFFTGSGLGETFSVLLVSSTSLRFIKVDSGNFVDFPVSSAFGVTSHYTLTYDHSLSELKLYIDGVTSVGRTKTLPSGTINSSRVLEIGGSIAEDQMFGGRQQEFAFYTRTLGQSEITAHVAAMT